MVPDDFKERHRTASVPQKNQLSHGHSYSFIVQASVRVQFTQGSKYLENGQIREKLMQILVSIVMPDS